jgi:hypothetical protein
VTAMDIKREDVCRFSILFPRKMDILFTLDSCTARSRSDVTNI